MSAKYVGRHRNWDVLAPLRAAFRGTHTPRHCNCVAVQP